MTLDKCLHRINSLRHLNAFIRPYLTHDDVISLPNPSQHIRPLEQLTFSVKDNFSVRNQPMTCASAFLSDYKPIHTATVVQRLLNAGGILIGHCNMDEFAMGIANLSSKHGPCYNPWGKAQPHSDLCEVYPRVPGGSSGGGAVAVLTGQSEFSLGSDTGGSVRLPSAYCGVVGFKPSYGALSRHGLVPLCSSTDCPGIIARNVQMVKRVLEVISGVDPLDSNSINIPERNHSNQTLRIGLPLLNNGSMVEECMKSRFKEALQNLEAAYDVILESADIPYLQFGVHTYNTISAVEIASNMAKYTGIIYGTMTDLSSSYKRSLLLGPTVKYRIVLGTQLSSRDNLHLYTQAVSMRRAISSALKRALKSIYNPHGYDVIITPATLGDAPRSDVIKSMGPVESSRLNYFLSPPSLAGLPAVSIPIGLSVAGMPLGLQVFGGVGRDWEVLQVAEMVQECNSHTSEMRNAICSISNIC